jgi:hypothetical protein
MNLKYLIFAMSIYRQADNETSGDITSGLFIKKNIISNNNTAFRGGVFVFTLALIIF